MSGPIRQAVVLAAGRASRLQPLSAVLPKPLAPVCNKPIMQHQIEAARDACIEHVLVVIGPSSLAIRDYFGDGRRLGVRMEYIMDPEPAGIAASLSLVASWVQDGFVAFLGDIFLRMRDLRAALQPVERGAAGALLVSRDTTDAISRSYAVLTEADGRVYRVIEKPANPSTDVKGCGVYVFDRAIFEAIRRTPRSAMRGEYEITDAIQILIEMGRPVFAAEEVIWDVNITYPEDLLACNLRLLREQQLEHLIGEGARVSQHARLVNSVVGERAVVEAPVLIEDCLVLPNAHVPHHHEPIRRRIFADGLVWAANPQT